MTADNRNTGLVHIYCGDGKGKTTAAMGLAARAAGSGKKVLITQFFKPGNSSELKTLALNSNIEIFSEKEHYGRVSNMSDEQLAKAKSYYRIYFAGIVEKSEDFDVIILDEIISAVNHNIVPLANVADFVDNRKEGLELVLTGRNPQGELIRKADYVTMMQKVKHPYDNGIMARKGIEF